jgi:hypothetical protein
MQAHLAHYARGSGWEEHESVLWVFNYSHLSSSCDRYFRLWAQITDSRSSWHSDPHEVQCTVVARGSRLCSSASTSSPTSSYIIIPGYGPYFWYRGCICSSYVIHGSSPSWSKSYWRACWTMLDWCQWVPAVPSPQAWWWGLIFFLLVFVRFWLATFWLTKSLVCIDAFIRDSTIQSDVRRFCTAYKSEDFGSLSAVWMTCHPFRTSICPLFHSDDVPYRLDAQTDLASFVWTT